jgi:hypothetical protein
MLALATEPDRRTPLAIVVQDQMARLAMSALAEVAAIAARRANRAAVDGPSFPDTAHATPRAAVGFRGPIVRSLRLPGG